MCFIENVIFCRWEASKGKEDEKLKAWSYRIYISCHNSKYSDLTFFLLNFFLLPRFSLLNLSFHTLKDQKLWVLSSKDDYFQTFMIWCSMFIYRWGGKFCSFWADYSRSLRSSLEIFFIILAFLWKLIRKFNEISS